MIPINYQSQHVRTADEWRTYRRHFCPRRNSIESAAKHYAAKNGKAIIFHSDDSATIVEQSTANKSGFSVHHLRPEQISWHANATLWQRGWNAYAAGLPLTDYCEPDQRKGWHAARTYYVEAIAA